MASATAWTCACAPTDVGEIAISVEGAMAYYSQRARDWEKQMLIKARVSAGDPEPGAALLEFVDRSFIRVRWISALWRRSRKPASASARRWPPGAARTAVSTSS